MNGHMQVLANSTHARKNKPELRVTPMVRGFVEANLVNLGLKIAHVKRELNVDVEKARLILKEVNRRRKQEGIVKEHFSRLGFIYLIENEAFEGWIKCGMTTTPQERLLAYNGYGPLKRFKMIALKEVLDRRKAESILLEKTRSTSSLQNGEWMKINKEDALKIFESIL